jgi:hypothetical protein
MLGPSGPLRLCRRQQKQQSFALSSNGPSTRPPQGHTLADLPVGTVLRVKGPPAINRFSVSRPRLQNSPRFPQAASTSPRRKRSINPDLLSLSLGYLLSKPRSSASRERCTNIWFNKTVPRSLPSLYPQIGLHSSASPAHAAALRCRYPPGPSIQSRSCGCTTPRFPASVATPCRRIRRINCRHRLPIAYSAALAAGAFFVSTTRHRSCHIQTTRRHYKQQASPTPSNNRNQVRRNIPLSPLHKSRPHSRRHFKLYLRPAILRDKYL